MNAGAYGKTMLYRTILLVPIALCIAIVISSQNANIRAFAAATAMTLEIIRDALLGSAFSQKAIERKRQGK